MFVARASIFLFLASVLHAAPMCVFGTLASYEALGAGGCTNGDFQIKNVAFSVITSGGTAVPIADTAIDVTPTGSGVGPFGFNFSSAGFSVSGTGFVKYLIAYTLDPRDIRSMDDLLDIAVVPPGKVTITTDGCVGAAFIGAVCPTFVQTVTVSDDGITPVLSDVTTFPPGPIMTLGIRNTIDLEGNTTGSASFDSFTSEASTPEPGTWTSAGVCLLAILMLRRYRRSKRCLKIGHVSLNRPS